MSDTLIGTKDNCIVGNTRVRVCHSPGASVSKLTDGHASIGIYFDRCVVCGAF